MARPAGPSNHLRIDTVVTRVLLPSSRALALVRFILQRLSALPAGDGPEDCRYRPRLLQPGRAKTVLLVEEVRSANASRFDTSHEELDAVHDEGLRQSRREEFSTPAMRMRLAKGPVRLETILSTDWRTKLMGPNRQAARKGPCLGYSELPRAERKAARLCRSVTIESPLPKD